MKPGICPDFAESTLQDLGFEKKLTSRGTEYKGHDARIDLSRMKACVHKRRLIVTHEHPEQRPQLVYQGCASSELTAFAKRHVVSLIKPTKEYLASATKSLLHLYHKMGSPKMEPMGYDELLATKSPHVKKRFERFRDSWNQDIESKDAIVKGFIKYERYWEEDIVGAKQKPPRMIQCRNPKFTARFSSFTTPIEHLLWRIKPWFGLRCFAKGRNTQQRASDIQKHWDHHTNTRALMIDHSKFDSRINKGHLKRCHRFYDRFFNSPLLRKLCKLQLKNICITSGGIFCAQNNRRMSGDADTALGNCLVNYTILEYLIAGTGCTFYLDGDDSIVFGSEAEIEALLTSLEAVMRECGMVSTYSVARRLSDVEFCQGKPIRTDDVPTLMRNPAKAVSSLCSQLNDNHVDTIRSQIGLGEMHSSSRCPIIYEVAKGIWEEFGAAAGLSPEYRHRVDSKMVPRAPTVTSRVYGAKAWGPQCVQQLSQCLRDKSRRKANACKRAPA